MFDLLLEKLSLINFQLFLTSMLFFFIGYALAPIAYYKKITLLTAYPLWIARKLEQWVNKKWNPYLLFLFLFSLNGISLLINLFSGFIPFLPVVLAVWTGLNVGLITFHMLKGELYFASLLNPVALFELPAAFLSFTLAIQYNLTLLNITVVDIQHVAFSEYLQLFLIIVIPLLFIAGIIETALIVYSQKLGNDKGLK